MNVIPLRRPYGPKIENIEEAFNHLEEEARMVLPGIQALFGFQLVAVFNQRFVELTPNLQKFHFVALVCSAIAVLLVLTPAAFHRQAEPARLTDYLYRLGSVCLSLSMLPLALGTAIDLYVIAALIFTAGPVPALVSAGYLALCLSAWFFFPQATRLLAKGE